MQVYKFTIAADFLPYIINGDATTFDYWGDFKTPEHIDWWLAKNTKELGSGHYSVPDDCSENFTTCDITGVYGNCVTIEYVVL